ncbi:hypothetical protein PHYBOEH_008231 [Phytophthora boehmeriae]|uniref:Uncharacterized protein n=1 Tax=Phytophthora boehmeriae TaxID=109152 RepID=A0A8T1W2K8_9STRA|nr:hypothetical protein PHYBOEH_008231 [Phytophthora boehmeriae]
MPRGRKKRTREEIQDALAENERVNATPAAPEEQRDRQRRQAKRRRTRYDLNKALRALNLGGEGQAVATTGDTVQAAPGPPAATESSARGVDQPASDATALLGKETPSANVCAELYSVGNDVKLRGCKGVFTNKEYGLPRAKNSASNSSNVIVNEWLSAERMYHK